MADSSAVDAACRGRLFRHVDVALLRGVVATVAEVPGWWPDPADTHSCREWLDEVWSRAEVAEAIGQASRSLAERVAEIRAGHVARPKQVRRATSATVGYLLRATGRPTPFGLFAGVAPVLLGRSAQVRWETGHQPVVRADAEWLADVLDGLEKDPELLDRIDVVMNDLAVRRGNRVEIPKGPGHVSIRCTSAARTVQEAAAVPVRFGVLVEKLTESFSDTEVARVRGMLTELVRQGFLITNLRAPFTVTDPLGHLIARLREVEAEDISSTRARFWDLVAIESEIRRCKTDSFEAMGQARSDLSRWMRRISPSGRTGLAVDLVLDCEVELPEAVAQEMELAAGVLLRLSRRRAGDPAWQNFHVAVLARYGTGTLVPVADVVDPAAGIGFPAGFPGSELSPPADLPLERDERLLSIAWQAMAERTTEVVLTDETVAAIAGDNADPVSIPPHVEVAGQVHAVSVEALERGDFTVIVHPGRSAGTLTSRFAVLLPGSGLAEAYRRLPTAADGALAAQISFPPAYPYAENVCRVPRYLDHILSMGEHRSSDGTVLTVDDLAVTATRDRLHLVSISRRQVVEPQVFHALALDKQPPPLARFLAHLSRAFGPAWHEFDWGPWTSSLSYLPRVRYRRTILSPARWLLSADDLGPRTGDLRHWREQLRHWRDRWQCPELVELRDSDRSLRLALDEPAHADLLRSHMNRHGHAQLIEAAPEEEFGWLAGHAHEVVLPLIAAREAAPCPVRGPLPRVSNTSHGHLPGAQSADWLEARIYSHPDRQDEIIADHLPALVELLDETPLWFVRYRSPSEPHHLRLRVRTVGPAGYARCASGVGEWAELIRQRGLGSRVTFDTYYPETGRYGDGASLEAAQAFFVADSQVVAAELRHTARKTVHPTALAATSMVHIASCFLGDPTAAWRWLISRPAPAAAPPDRAVADQAHTLVVDAELPNLRGWPSEIQSVWRARIDALAAYSSQLPEATDTDDVLESLLHMHHNRTIGINPESERACRHLARQAALSCQARHHSVQR